MNTRSINLGRVSAATAAMFDILADGDWHETTILQREGALAHIADDFDDACARGERLRSKSVRAGKDIKDFEFALSGGNDRARNNLMIAVRRGRLERRGTKFRMMAATRRYWLDSKAKEVAFMPVMSDDPQDTAKIRVFANIREDDAFTAAPAKDRDRVMFRTNYEIPLKTFRARLSVGWLMTHEPEVDLYRIDGPARHGRIIESYVRDWCAEEGWAVTDLRVIEGMKKRELCDLDPNFLDALFRYYQPFLAKRMRKHNSTLSMHFDDPADVQQQMGEWVLAALREYDETKSVPFGAFLVIRTSCRVHDLTRKQVGRTMADTEHARKKVIAAFSAEHYREPNPREIAALMGKTMPEYRRIAADLDSMRKLRDPMSIQGLHEDDQEVQIPTTDDASSPLMSDAEEAHLAASLIQACANDKGTNAPNLVAFGHYYYKTWGGLTKAQTADAMKVSSQTVTNAAERAKPALMRLLKTQS